MLGSTQHLVEFLQAGMRADFVETLLDLIARELSHLDQPFIDVGKVNRRVVWAAGQRVSSQQPKSIINMLHLGQFVLLVIDAYAPIFKPDIASVVALAVFEDGHQALFAGGKKAAADIEIVDRQIAVAIEHIKGVAELGQCPDNCAACSQKLRTVDMNNRCASPIWRRHRIARRSFRQDVRHRARGG